MARKPKPTRKSRAAHSPALVGRGQGEGFGKEPVPAVVGRGQGRVKISTHRRPSAVLDTRVIYCGDCLDQLKRLPDACIDLLYIDPPFNSNRNYEVFCAETRRVGSAHHSHAPRFSSPLRRITARAEASGLPAHFADRHASTAAYIHFMRPRCVELADVAHMACPRILSRQREGPLPLPGSEHVR